MWYALYCPSKEEELIRSCREKLDGRILRDTFQFTFEQMRRYEGRWHTETKKLFPDYIFLESDDAKGLSGALEQYRDFVKIMESGTLLIPVEKEEEEALRSLCGREHHLRMSRGIVRGGAATVTEGPLVGRENMIRRIDRHKRLAFLTGMPGMNGKCIRAGLEIVEKN